MTSCTQAQPWRKCVQAWHDALPSLVHCKHMQLQVPRASYLQLPGPHKAMLLCQPGSQTARLSRNVHELRQQLAKQVRVALLLSRHDRCGRHSHVRRLPVPLLQRILDDSAPWPEQQGE